MGDRVKRRSAAMRAVRAALWTGALVLGLVVVDRAVLGPEPVIGWVVTDDVTEVPAEAGRVVVPAYLPRPLVWPPVVSVFRTSEPPGWWVGIAADKDPAPWLWVGSGVVEPPAALGRAGACLAGRCVDDWRHLSMALPDGRTVQVLTRVESVESSRILEGIRLAAQGSPTRP